jgi:hypothetical protein
MLQISARRLKKLPNPRTHLYPIRNLTASGKILSFRHFTVFFLATPQGV